MTTELPRPDIQVGPDQEAEWPGSSSLATDCVLNLASLAGRLLSYGLEIAVANGVPSVAAFNVLTILHGEGGPLLPSTIAERTILTRGTITGIVGSLERRGLLERAAPLRDGRMRPIRITADGVNTVERILPLLHQVERRWMEPLTADEQWQLLPLIATVQANGPDRPSG